VLTSLALSLDEFAHELAHELRGRPVRRCGFLDEGIPQSGFELHGENDILGHGGLR
jgi:hypothetical protein